MQQRRRLSVPKKPQAKPKKQGKRSLPGQIALDVWAVALIALGFLVILGFYFNAAGIFGEWVKRGGLGLLGAGAYLLPIAFIAVGLELFASKEVFVRKYFAAIFATINISALIHLFSGNSPARVSELYISGEQGIGGGFLGGIIAMPLRAVFSEWGAGVILFSALLIFIIIFTDFSLLSFFSKLWEKAAAARLKRAARREREGQAAFDDEASRPAPKKKEEFEPKIRVYDSAPPVGRAEKAPEPEPEPEAPPEEEKYTKAVAREAAEEIAREILKGAPPISYTYPDAGLLGKEVPPAGKEPDKPENLRESAKKLVETLSSFGVEAKVLEVSRGPTVTRFELQPSPGVKVSKIVNLADDIALNLAAFGVRIEAPIPGKAAVGIEIPNRSVTTVHLRDVIESKEFKGFASRLAFAVGKDITGKSIVEDITRMPHLLIAGATGSGKSVCINALITSILYKAAPDEVKLLMIDPKVVELGVYNGIPHLLIPVVTDPRKAAGALNWAVQEMVGRYKTFADANVRDIYGYNAAAAASGAAKMEQIVIIIDELADLMMVAPNDVEDSICRLAQMARAAGMHLVIATQRPSVDVITGVIKANIPSRISFAVSSHIDSRTILDMGGAEKLLGRGDMLFLPVGKTKPVRIQGAFISDKDVERVVKFLKEGFEPDYDEDVIEKVENMDKMVADDADESDDFLPRAIEIVVDAGMASVSLLQRKLRIGHSRAGRLIDQMEMRGIVGPHEGSKPRSVLVSKQEYYEMIMNE